MFYAPAYQRTHSLGQAQKGLLEMVYAIDSISQLNGMHCKAYIKMLCILY
jgi:hypothetical protein